MSIFTTTRLALAAAVLTTAAITIPLYPADSEEHAAGHTIAFPKDYKTTFTNYLSLDRTQNPGQIIRLFANDIAIAGPGPDGKLADGAIIVGEVYKARKDKDGNVVTSDLGRQVRGKLAVLAVMQKGKGWGAQFPDELRNGDWDFSAFKPDGSSAKKDLNKCRGCHAPLTDTDHLFSFDHLTQ